MSTKTETITPEIAKKYLATMKTNRNLRRSLVERYANEMTIGQWKLTGEAIKFNTNGELIDGQHRLNAVIESGKTIQVDVRRGLDPEVFMNLDTGGARSPGDMLNVAGFQYTSNIASTIRQASSILEAEAGVINPISLGKKRIAPAILLEWAQEHEEELTEAVRMTMTADAKLICSPPSLFSALYFLFAQYNKKGAHEFFETLTHGVEFEHGDHDPVYQLRKMLLAANANKQVRRPSYYKAAITIKAWNAFQNREEIHLLKYSENEVWPEISRRKTRLAEAQATKNRAKKDQRRTSMRTLSAKKRTKKRTTNKTRKAG